MSAVRRVPRAAWACALAALLGLLAWSLLTPPFHVPDETTHVAYVEWLAQTGKPPVTKATTVLPPEEQAALDRLYFGSVAGQNRNFPPDIPAEQRALRTWLAAVHGRRGNGDAGTATAQPPLFYALQTIPYALGSHGDILTRLSFMRVLSCLFGALTVLFCFGFVREVLPREPWAWTVGALAAAFQPTFAFMSSGVNPDAMLYAAAAALFFVLARAFRRGLTVRRGALIGLAVAVGALAKLNFLGLMPGVVLALLWLAWRGRRDRAAPLGAATAVAVAAAPLLLYVVLNVAVWDRPAFGAGGLATLARPGVGTGTKESLGGLLSYTWQLYLPRLPGMTDFFPALPLQNLWFNGLVGHFGWLDYTFPGWVYTLALWVAVAVAGLAVAGLVRVRDRIPRHWAEIVTYLLMTVGLLFIIARSGYQARTSGENPFEQARYLLPLLAPYAALVALAARAGGRRWGPVLGAVLVVIVAGHYLFAGLLTLSRYYG